MKKLFLPFFCVAVLFFGFITTVYSFDLPDTLDVGIFYGQSAKKSVELTIDGETFNLSAEDVFEDTEYISENDVIDINGTSYHGSVILKPGSNGLLTVINRVETEQYIASVLGREMSYSFEPEALKAQAVCARTYAAKNLGKHKKHGFDVCATNDCQVYGGISAEHENTITAAEETAGEILEYKGEIIQTVYFATSGGYTESAEFVWGTDFPYLTAVSDEYESKDVYASTWTATYTVDKLTEVFEERDYGVGTVTDIEATKVTENGAVYELVITGTEGTKTLKRESCRTFLGAKLLSQAYTVEPTGKTEKILTTSGSVDANSISTISAKGKDKISDKKFLVVSASGEKTYKIKQQVDGFLFTGRGWGHLVGMSQNGANGMAKAGFDYEEILTHYYQGTNIRR